MDANMMRAMTIDEIIRTTDVHPTDYPFSSRYSQHQGRPFTVVPDIRDRQANGEEADVVVPWSKYFKPNHPATSTVRLSHGHVVDFATSYNHDYSLKSTATRQTRPSSKSRKHNPHPSHLYHLRRLYNEPVCHVRTLFKGPETTALGASDGYLATSMKEHYPPRKLPSHKSTRFGCNKHKKYFANGIVPHDPDTEPTLPPVSFPERMLPACSKTTTMTTEKPYVPKRKRLDPAPTGESWDMSEPLSFLVEDDVGHSIGVRRPMRKRQIPGSRCATLKVTSFNGSLPADPNTSITGRKLCRRPPEFYDYYDRKWGAAETKPKWVGPY